MNTMDSPLQATVAEAADSQPATDGPMGLAAVPGSALRGCDTLMESAVRLMVATLARGGCTHDMPIIARRIGLSEVHLARMASLLTECADSLRHAQNNELSR